MMKICLCLKIHIPAIQNNYRFFNINRRHQYYDDVQLRNHTLKVYYGNLLPLFETVKNLSKTNEGKFKVALSISGITLALFKRFIPEAIELLQELKQKNYVEFLSETWSNSILAYFSNRVMIRQIMMHDTTMESMFGFIPSVFVTHSPVSSPETFNTIFDCGKNNILTYSNHIHQLSSMQKNGSENELSHIDEVFFINYKAGRALQEFDTTLNLKSIDYLPKAVYKKIKRNLSVSMPQAIIFNAGELKRPFTIGDSMIWKMAISDLVSDPEIMLVFPSELKYDLNDNFNNCVTQARSRTCKLPDVWIKNNLQKDAFSRQLKMNKLIPFAEIMAIVEEWDIMHDMDYLYYMDNHFLEPKFTATHFNPFSGPYLAYTNYMNVLDDFEERMKKQQSNIVNEASFRGTKKYVNE